MRKWKIIHLCWCEVTTLLPGIMNENTNVYLNPTKLMINDDDNNW